MLDGWSHRSLVNYMKNLGYKSSDAGVCYGYVHMGIQEALTGAMDRFDGTIAEMARDQKNGYTLTTPQRGQLGITPLLDGIEVHYQPQLHAELFERNKAPPGQNVLASAPLVMSTQVRKQGGIAEYSNFSGVYPPDDLVAYFALLKQSLQNAKPAYIKPVAFSLGDTKHVIGIGYDPKKDQWCLIDANNIPTQYHQSPQAIAAAVQKAFVSPEHDKTVTFTTKIYSTRDKGNEAALNQVIANWQAKPQMKQMHEVTPENANFTDALSVSWLIVAARNGQVDTVKKLLQQANIDPNKPDKDGFTPLEVAACFGHTEVVRELLTHPSIEPNKAMPNGVTPLHIAAQTGQVEVFKLILEHGGDPELRTEDGYTALDIAMDFCQHDIIEEIVVYREKRLDQTQNSPRQPAKKQGQDSNADGTDPLFIKSAAIVHQYRDTQSGKEKQPNADAGAEKAQQIKRRF